MEQLKPLIPRICITVCCLGLGLLLIFSAKNRIHQYNIEGADLTQQIFEMENLLDDSKNWEQRSNWVNLRIPRFDSAEEACEFLLGELAKSSELNNLKIKRHKFHRYTAAELLDMEKNHHFKKAIVRVVIQGNEENIVKCVHQLQQPDNFVGINQLEMKIGNTDLECELEICQWFLSEFEPSYLHATAL